MESTPSLPLDWTRIKRRRIAKGGQDGDSPTKPFHKADDACIDPTCCVPAATLPEEEDSQSNLSLISGTAIFCLPDPDCDWFQGYLVSDNSDSYGMLCIANDDRVDACLKCDDFRLLDIHVNDYQRKKKHTFKNIVCRGGDAMKWNHRHLSFDTTCLLTGTPAFEHVRQYFGSLLKNLGGESAEKSMPAVAVVKGSLQLWIPTKEASAP